VLPLADQISAILVQAGAATLASTIEELVSRILADYVEKAPDSEG
jgi:hypothetical protein